jgi:acyl-coenzyme A synthetase/AMP-(fatty) acid ligase
MLEVAEVTVYGEKNAIMGQIVCAAIRLRELRDRRQFHRELRQFAASGSRSFRFPSELGW